MTTALLIAFFILSITLVGFLLSTQDKIAKLEKHFDSRLILHWDRVSHMRIDIRTLEELLEKSEEKRKKMGDSFFSSLKSLREEVNVIDGFQDMHLDLSARQHEEHNNFADATNEMILELAVKLDYLENK